MKQAGNSWIFPCNPGNYDVLTAFASLETIDWGTNSQVIEGDTVYIYVGKPVSKIVFKTKVINEDVPRDQLINDEEFLKDHNTIAEKKKCVRLELEKSFLDKKNYLSYENLKEHGLTSKMQGVLNLDNNSDLSDYIKLVEV